VLKLIYSFTISLIVLLGHLFVLQQISLPIAMNHSLTPSHPVMVNLIVAQPKSAPNAKKPAISSQSVSPGKKSPVPPVSQKSVKQLKNRAINKKNTTLKKVIKKSKPIITKSGKKLQINQHFFQSSLVSPPVKIKPNSVKPSQQPIQLKSPLMTSTQLNKSTQSGTKISVAGKTTSAAINNHHFAGANPATPSIKPHNQTPTPGITSKNQNSPLPKSKTIAPVFLGGKPPYPWLSKRNNEAGKVLLRIQVNTQGKATIIQIKHSSGSARLDNAAVNHVQNNVFVPAQRDGKPIIAWKELRFVFQLN
jgi:TonB family protein